MPNPLDQIAPEKRILLAAALCILVSFLFSSLMAPPPPKEVPPGPEETTLVGDNGPKIVSPVEGEKPLVSEEELKTDAPEPVPAEVDGEVGIGTLTQKTPPPIREVVIDTPEERFVFSTEGATLRSCQLKNYWEFDPPIPLLEAQANQPLPPEEKAFWLARTEEAKARAAELEGYKYRKGDTVPEEAWVELVPPYDDSAGYPLRMRFGSGVSDENLVYECDTDSLVLGPEDEGEVRFTARTAAGVVLTKTISFSGSDPAFRVAVETEAPGGVETLKTAFKNHWSLEWPDGLQHLPFQYHGSQEANQLYALLDDSKDQTPTLRSWLLKQVRKMSDGVIPDDYRHALVGRVGWINVETRYFIASFLPQGPPMQGVYLANRILERPAFDTRVGMGVISEFSESPRTVKVYAGPKLTSVLAELGSGLDRVVYDSWFGSVCLLVEKLLGFFYRIFPSYGLAIILLCVLSKIVLYPLSYKQAQTQKKMAVLQPKIAELKEKYKDDSQKLSQEQMKLWKKHGVNPAGGCLPLVAQIPIFIALYRTIQSSIDLRGASFLWINDLSLPDMTFFLPVSLPFLGNALNVLPFVMMVISMIQMNEQKKMMPDPSQAKMMMFMTAFFFFILYHFSSGLVLYWTANSLTQWIQQKAMERLGHSAPRGINGSGANGNDEDDNPSTGADTSEGSPKKKTIPPRKSKVRRRRPVR